MPLGTVVTIQNLEKKSGSWNQSIVATLIYCEIYYVSITIHIPAYITILYLKGEKKKKTIAIATTVPLGTVAPQMEKKRNHETKMHGAEHWSNIAAF